MNNIHNTPQPDSLHRFLFEKTPIRGELVHLDTAWRSIIERHEYPEVLRNLMGELAAAAVLLAATLKLNGSLVLQIMGKGAVKLLVVECSGDMQMRATAKWSGDLLQGSFAELIGNGQFVITLDPKDGGQPYQGIVAIEGTSVAEVMQNYMSHSEQLETRLWLAADGQHAAGLLLQKLPGKDNHDSANQSVDSDTDAWRRAAILADTLKAEELLLLPVKTLIQRLYHEDDIRLFDAQKVAFYCSCSRDNVAKMLQMLGREEVDGILAERENIEVHCEFCNQRYEFDKVDAEMMFVDAIVLPPSESRH
jgi:molecular chaperone Hsp33